MRGNFFAQNLQFIGCVHDENAIQRLRSNHDRDAIQRLSSNYDEAITLKWTAFIHPIDYHMKCATIKKMNAMLIPIAQHWSKRRTGQLEGRESVSMDDGRFKLLDTYYMQKRDETEEAINSIDISWDGSLVATSSQDEKIQIYCTNSGMYDCVLVLIQKYGVGLVRFTWDSQKVVTSSCNGWDETIRHLDLERNMYFRYFKGHRSSVNGISFACKGRDPHIFVSSSMDDTVRLWDLRSSKTQALLHEVSPAIALDPLGLVLACSTAEGLLKLYDIRNLDNSPFVTLKVAYKPINWCTISFAPNGLLLTLSSTGEKIYIVDSFSGRTLHILKRPNPNITSLETSFSPDSEYLISGGSDGFARIWDVKHGNEVALWQCNDDMVSHVRWCPTKELSICGGSNLTFWASNPEFFEKAYT